MCQHGFRRLCAVYELSETVVEVEKGLGNFFEQCFTPSPSMQGLDELMLPQDP